MDILTLTGVLLLIFSMLSLGTGIYAFRKYSLMRSERLFVVGLSLSIAATGTACGAVDSLHLLPSFNLGWAWYTGTSIGFFLLFLSSVMGSNNQFQFLKRWSIIAAVVLITVILLTPVFPAVYPNLYVPLSLNSLRTALCFPGFVRYLMIYTLKGTRFSLLMCLAFLFITAGYAILIPQLLNPSLVSLMIVGTFIRIIGAGVLLAAFILG